MLDIAYIAKRVNRHYKIIRVLLLSTLIYPIYFLFTSTYDLPLLPVSLSRDEHHHTTPLPPFDEMFCINGPSHRFFQMVPSPTDTIPPLCRSREDILTSPIHLELEELITGKIKVDKNWTIYWETMNKVYPELTLESLNITSDNWQYSIPGLYIIGFAKSGTTSLHHLFAKHPKVVLPTTKEPHFFSFPTQCRGGFGGYLSLYHPIPNEPKSFLLQLYEATNSVMHSLHKKDTFTSCLEATYKRFPEEFQSNYPSSLQRHIIDNPKIDKVEGDDQPPLLIESSVSYAAHPYTPFRIRWLFEKISPSKPIFPKIVFMVRDPVSRAYSMCKFLHGALCTPYNFDSTVREEIQGLKLHERAMQNFTEDIVSHYTISVYKTPTYRKYTYNLTRFSQYEPEIEGITESFDREYNGRVWFAGMIVTRGIYEPAIKLWYKVFPRENIKILDMSDLSNSTVTQTMEGLVDWLELEKMTEKEDIYEKSNVQNHTNFQPMWDSTKQLLKEFYKPYNQDLVKLTGRKFSWCN